VKSRGSRADELPSWRDVTSANVPWISRGLKRTLDLVVAAFLIVFLAPLFIVFAIAIKFESRGPVFYRAARAGWHGQTLHVLKFRKMYDGATGRALTGNFDPRFTRIGRLLARTKLDELPQLWNVLRGQMSLVGPRPEDVGFVNLHAEEYRDILSVRPGITGLTQLAFAREADILDPLDSIGHYVDGILPQKVDLDVLYAHTRTFRGDVSIALWTVLPVFLRLDVAVNRRTGALTVRRRPPPAAAEAKP
jgi:lipopolysaccharide/colanic/teichoic acid biosynthesis glycosyltransferase